MNKEEILDKAEKLYPAEKFARFEIANNSVKWMEREAFVKGVVWAVENQWIDVFDKLPEGDEPILVYNGLITEFCVFDGKNFYNSNSKEINHIRYWMPIPNTPKS